MTSQVPKMSKVKRSSLFGKKMAKFSPKLGFQGIGSSDLFRFFQELKESIVMKSGRSSFLSKNLANPRIGEKRPQWCKVALYLGF